MRKLLISLLPLSFFVLLLFEKDLAMVGDLGRHLKLGEIVIHCLCVPQKNLFSYTNPDFPIVNHEWLGEVIFYLVSAWFGLNGLIIFKMLLLFSAASLVYVTALKKSSLFWVSVFSIPAAILFSMRFFVLPELYSYVFIGLFLFLIERYKQTKQLLLLVLLIPIEILWVNMHIYFIVGVAMYGWFMVEELVNFLFKKPQHTGLKTQKTQRISVSDVSENLKIRHAEFLSLPSFLKSKLFFIGIFLILSTLLNPSFVKGALLPFTFSSNYGFPVEENMSPFQVLSPSTTNTNVASTLYIEVFLFELLALIFVICLFIKMRWKELFHTGNGITGLLLGLRYTRCIGLFPLLSFIPFVQSLTYLEKRFGKEMDAPARNSIKGIIVLAVFILALLQMKGLSDYNVFGFGFVPSAEQAVSFFKQTNIQGRIFNNYIVGNYLIYGLYPKEQVYVDARPEAYPSAFFNDYWRMMSDSQFFADSVQKYHINAVVFNVAMDDPAKIRPFLLRLLHSPDWVPVYADGTVTILVRNISVNQEVIRKYRIVVQ